MSTDDFINFNQTQFLKEIRSFLKDNDMSIRKFAALAGISTGTWARAAYGKVKVKFDLRTIIKLKKAMRDYEP